MESTFFGQFLLAEGIVTTPQLTAAVEYQNQFNARLGEYAVALGCITPFEAEKINALQVEKDLRFGEAAMRLGLFDRGQLQSMIEAQRNEHLLLGQALLKLGYVDDNLIHDAFRRYLETQTNVTDIRVPDGHPLAAVAGHYFEGFGQLLARAWKLPNKNRRLSSQAGAVLLSDRNAQVEISGDLSAHLLIGVPHDAVRKAADNMGRTVASDQTLDELVGELLHMAATRLKESVAAEGMNVEAAPAQTSEFRITLDDDLMALVVPHLTHEGQIIAVMIA